jgi:hypothetical protein
VTVRHALPTTTELQALSGEQELAVTIYAATSPVVPERERAQVAVKSFFDEAIERARALGATQAQLEAVRQGQAELSGYAELWTDVARSLAIFVAPGLVEVYVLPNRLEDALHVGRHFSLGQLSRAQGLEQEAFALTLSHHAWQLWHATPTARAAVLETKGTWARDADSAVPHGERSLKRVGDEYQKSILEGYATYVADAVKHELGALDVHGTVPLVVFANEPLASLFQARANARRSIVVKGAPDRLDAATVDECVRKRLAALAVEDTNTAIAALAETDPSRVAGDLVTIARAAVAGAVDTYYFDFTATKKGRVDEETGLVEFAGPRHDEETFPDGSPATDLLARVASLVQDKGGTVVAVRGPDLDPTLWTSPALARLRFGNPA